MKNLAEVLIFHTRDLCLRALDTNSFCAKTVRRNEDYYEQENEVKYVRRNIKSRAFKKII